MWKIGHSWVLVETRPEGNHREYQGACLGAMRKQHDFESGWMVERVILVQVPLRIWYISHCRSGLCSIEIEHLVGVARAERVCFLKTVSSFLQLEICDLPRRPVFLQTQKLITASVIVFELRVQKSAKIFNAVRFRFLDILHTSENILAGLLVFGLL